MSAKSVPDPKEAAEHRERMKAFYRKVGLCGLTLLPVWDEPEAKGPTGASGEPQKPAPASEDVKPGHP